MAIDGRKINVLRVTAEKTLFQLMADRLSITEVEDHAATSPDLLVVADAKGHLDFSSDQFRLSPDLVDRVRAGLAAVVFDCSSEGMVHSPSRTAQLHSYIERTGLPPNRCVYITQDRTYRSNYLAHCRDLGWRQPVTVLNYDYYISLIFRSSPTKGQRIFNRRLEFYRSRLGHRNKRFLCLNFTPRYHKTLFLLQLLHDDLWDLGYISFGGFSLRGLRATQLRKFVSYLNAVEGWGDKPARLAQLVPELDRRGQVLFGDLVRTKSDPNRIKAPYYDMDLREHDDSWFTIVSETEMEGPRRITEKSIKPLLSFHPFIVLGNSGSLELIRELGFRTFPGYFDESYDQEPNPAVRFEMVVDEVRRICGLDETKLKRMEEEADDVLVHNARWGLVEMPVVYRETIDRRLLSEILEVLGPEPIPPA